MEETKKKRYYIYENIDQIKDHDQIIDLIELKKCKFTKNNNGIFLNLSVLNEEMINMIYQIIINSLDYEKTEINHITEYVNNFEEKENKKEEEKSLEEVIQVNLFQEEDQDIIRYSKKYNL